MLMHIIEIASMNPKPINSCESPRLCWHRHEILTQKSNQNQRCESEGHEDAQAVERFSIKNTSDLTESDSNHSNPFKFHACDTFILTPSCAGALFRPMAAFALQNEGPRNKMHHFSPKSHEMRGKAMTSL